MPIEAMEQVEVTAALKRDQSISKRPAVAPRAGSGEGALRGTPHSGFATSARAPR
jgi:hypothetical protein